MQLQKRDARTFYTGIMLAEQLEDKFDQHFTYALGKNRRKLRDEIESLNDAEKKSLKEYNEKLDELSDKYGKRDDKQHIIMNRDSVTLDDVWEYNKAYKKLNDEYEELLDKNKEFSREEIEVDVFKVDNKYFPNLPGAIADYLFPMRRDLVEEEEEELKKEENARKAEEGIKK